MDGSVWILSGAFAYPRAGMRYYLGSGTLEILAFYRKARREGGQNEAEILMDILVKAAKDKLIRLWPWHEHS